jgi:hypothetical protein
MSEKAEAGIVALTANYTFELFRISLSSFRSGLLTTIPFDFFIFWLTPYLRSFFSLFRRRKAIM